MKSVVLALCLLVAVVSACAPNEPPSTLAPSHTPTIVKTMEPSPTPQPAATVTEAPPDETPTDTATEAVAEIPTEPAEVPTEVPSDAPTEPVEVPTDVPTEVPTEPVQVPTEVPTDIPTEATASPDSTEAIATIAPTAVVAAATDAAPTTPLRVGVLPVLNALPLYVAELERFYQQQGVEVDVITFASAREREQAMQRGEIDGETTDLVSVVLLKNAGIDLRAVRWDTTVSPFFSIVVSGDSDIETVEDLKGVPIAIAENTVLEYMTRVLLLEAGFTEDEIRLVNIASIPRRIEALENGQIAAATLPEPLTAQLVAEGARVVANDEATNFVGTVFAFSDSALAERGDDVRAFLRAYEQAIDAIHENPDNYAGLFIASSSLPEAVRMSYPVPQYRSAGVTSDDELNALIEWMNSNGMMRQRLDNNAYVDNSYLP